MFRDFVAAYRKQLDECYAEIPLEKVERVADILLRARREDRRIFFLGNGGSATTASHMAVDFGKGTAVAGRPRFRAVSLTDNVGLITAWSNDASYESIFKEQLENLLEPSDVVVAISASGNSPNVLRAVEFARKRGAITIGLIGFGGGKLKDLVDVDVSISSRNYGQVEDVHLTLDHILSQYLKARIDLELGGKDVQAVTDSYLKFFFSEPPSSGTRSAILLDRDGVINERVVGGYVTDWKEFKFREGIKQAMASLEGLDLPIVVISNQACVGKRLVSPGDLEDITRRFVEEFRESGVQIDAVYYCPHTSEQGCNCRKPRSGLIEAAALEWKIDLTRSVFIGDSASDLQAARALHCPSVFVRPENGASNAGIAEKQSFSALTVKQTSEIPGAVSRLLQALPG